MRGGFGYDNFFGEISTRVLYFQAGGVVLAEVSWNYGA